MSTPIALVTCADVSSDRRMCSMTPRRIAVIGSTDSPAMSGTSVSRSAATGCGLTGAFGASGGGATAATGSGVGAGAGAAPCGSGATGAGGAFPGPFRGDRLRFGSSADRTFWCDQRKDGPDVDRRPLLDEDLGDDSLARARNLGVDLVGRDLEQRLVEGDVVADLLQPLGDGALGHRHAHLGHHDL